MDAHRIREETEPQAGGPAGRTPNLDRLAAESRVFSRTYAQSTEILFSHASLFSGRYASVLEY